MDRSINFVSPLNAPKSIVLSPHLRTSNLSNSVSETKLPFTKFVILYSTSQSSRTSGRWIKGTEFNDVPPHLT